MQQPKGARIATPGPAGTIHEGILDYDAQGRPWVIENSKLSGQVVYRPIGAGEGWRLVEVAPQGQESLIVMRALALRGKRYDVATYNCQHFVSEVYSGEPTSWQLPQYLFTAGLALLAVLPEQGQRKRASKKGN
jgi:hypothetical protein